MVHARAGSATCLAVLVVEVVLACSLPALALELILHRHADASLLRPDAESGGASSRVRGAERERECRAAEGEPEIVCEQTVGGSARSGLKGEGIQQRAYNRGIQQRHTTEAYNRGIQQRAYNRGIQQRAKERWGGGGRTSVRQPECAQHSGM